MVNNKDNTEQQGEHSSGIYENDGGDYDKFDDTQRLIYRIFEILDLQYTLSDAAAVRRVFDESIVEAKFRPDK